MGFFDIFKGREHGILPKDAVELAIDRLIKDSISTVNDSFKGVDVWTDLGTLRRAFAQLELSALFCFLVSHWHDRHPLASIRESETLPSLINSFICQARCFMLIVATPEFDEFIDNRKSIYCEAIKKSASTAPLDEVIRIFTLLVDISSSIMKISIFPPTYNSWDLLASQLKTRETAFTGGPLLEACALSQFERLIKTTMPKIVEQLQVLHQTRMHYTK